MINTFNESKLHKSLKSFYATQSENSATEVKSGPYIVDIQNQDGSIIEIQTGSLGKLKEKIIYFTDQKIKITVVYPLAVTKYIETESADAKNTIKRKSPVSKNIYSIFKELTSLYEVLLNKYFYLEVLEVEVTETRKTTNEPVQSKNGRRRFQKNWLKTGKYLNQINSKSILNGKVSYKKLIPFNKDETFTIKQLASEIKKSVPKVKTEDLRYLAWIYQKINLIEMTGKEKNAKVYKVK